MELFEQHALHCTMNFSSFMVYPGARDPKRKQTHKAAKRKQKKRKIIYISQTPRLDSDPVPRDQVQAF